MSSQNPRFFARNFFEWVWGTRAILFIVLFAAAFFAFRACVPVRPDENLVRRLRMELAGEGQDVHNYIAREIIEADPAQRKKLIAAVVQVTTDAFNSPQPRSDTDGHRIVTSAYVLRAVSDDEATLAAFGSHLTEVEWPPMPPIIGALASCRDPRAVKALAGFARLRLKQISQWPLESPPSWTDEQKRIACDSTLCFLCAVEGLANSANPSGKVVARELRDKFVKLYDGSSLRDEILHTLETSFRIDPALRGIAQPPRRSQSGQPGR